MTREFSVIKDKFISHICITYTVGATSERTAAGKTEKLIFRAFFSSKM